MSAKDKLKRFSHRSVIRFIIPGGNGDTLLEYQVVIPRSVRVSLGLGPGMKLQVIAYNGRVEFLPVRKPAELRGLLQGLEPVIERESDRL